MEQFFSLLRFSLGITDSFKEKLSEKEWIQIFKTAHSQALVGVIFCGVKKLGKELAPPFNIMMQWMAEAEKIRGLNTVFYAESKRLTELFEANSRKTAILKGQANSRLYPDMFCRQPGDIDIYVEGGKESVIKLIDKLGMLPPDLPEGALKAYHHVHLPENEKGVSVEVHFRPSSGFHNKFYNNRLQQCLNENLKDIVLTPEGFYAPSMRFALLMQLAHIERHFMMEGIGLRQLNDYYFLLKKCDKDDREYVAERLKRFNLKRFTKALMWILNKIFLLEEEFMLCGMDEALGKKIMADIISGGNFGWDNKKQITDAWSKFFVQRKRNWKMFSINTAEALPVELAYWKCFLKNMPRRIRYRTLSLENMKKDEKN
ncbi:MAG: nucleotidyltransferase family protein [Bacteroidales bacterium]|nr:nucleotidyltransferase family protein [Bacteroidales bacterium]